MHLEANQANQAVTVTVNVNGTGIVNVIDYSLLVQNALPNCGRSAQGAPFAQLSLRLCVLLLSRKMRTLAKDFHRCCKNLPSVGEEKSRYSVFISRLRPGKRFSGISVFWNEILRLNAKILRIRENSPSLGGDRLRACSVLRKIFRCGAGFRAGFCAALLLLCTGCVVR